MRVALAYTTVVLIWSTTPLAIKFSAASFPFVLAVGLRMALAACLCVMLLMLARQALPRHGSALKAYGAANLGVFGAMSCVYFSMAYIPSGLTSVIFGLAPMLSALFARPLLGEAPLSRARWLAIAVALGGLTLVFSGELQLVGTRALPGLVACLTAVTLFALSGVLVKRHATGLTPLQHTSGSLLLSLPLFTALWSIQERPLPEAPEAVSVAGIVYLAVMGSVVGFMLYFFVLQRLTTTQVSLIPLITPAFALALGNWVAGEHIGLRTVIGGGLILLALAGFQLGDSRWRRPSTRRAWRRLRRRRARASLAAPPLGPTPS